MHEMKPPQAAGLYHPENEHDACGVAFVAKLTEGADHGVVDRALFALENLEHRGAAGADPTTGDGAGILRAAARRVPARGRRTSSCRRPAATASASASCRTTTRAATSSSR